MAKDQIENAVLIEHRREKDALTDALVGEYRNALVAGDQALAESIIDQAISGGVQGSVIHARIIAVAMIQIGDLWEENKITVGDEHLATAISHQMLAGIYPRLQVATPRSKERILLAAVAGQQHVLGLRMVADVLEGAGYDVKYLGADVPLDSLVSAVVTHEPRIIGLSASMTLGQKSLIDAIAALREVAPSTPILLGGQAIPLQLRASGIPYAGTSEEALNVVEAILAGRVSMPDIATFTADEDDSPRFEAESEASAGIGKIAQIAADSADLARDQARRAYEFETLAHRDPVTGQPNRLAFDEKLAAIARSDLHLPYAVLMLDLDDFKSVNDTHGHAIGDYVLNSVAHVIRDQLRDDDFLARYGGDEFGLVLPSTSESMALAIGERIRAAVDNSAIEPHQTVSIGVANFDGDSRRSLLRADQALYDAKEAGRNAIRSVAAS